MRVHDLGFSVLEAESFCEISAHSEFTVRSSQYTVKCIFFSFVLSQEFSSDCIIS